MDAQCKIEAANTRSWVMLAMKNTSTSAEAVLTQLIDAGLLKRGHVLDAIVGLRAAEDRERVTPPRAVTPDDARVLDALATYRAEAAKPRDSPVTDAMAASYRELQAALRAAGAPT